MLLSDTPSWSKKQLARLGRSLATGAVIPENCPAYDDVMLWHHELAACVAEEIDSRQWTACPEVELQVSSRGKTVDTLVQKLIRTSIGLDQVQDLAGVRVDAALTLTQQTDLAHEVADHFKVGSRGIRDLRDSPHSGYRAFHLWLRLPAGRVEVQIRTEGQSEWANTYERLGDLLGRGIRYDMMPDEEKARDIVDFMHRQSTALTDYEKTRDQMAHNHSRDWLDGAIEREHDSAARERLIQLRDEFDRGRERSEELVQLYIDRMREIRRIIEDLEEVG